jgi:hypothetical protein
MAHMVDSSRLTTATVAGRPAWGFTIVDGDNFDGWGERSELGQEGKSSFPYIYNDGDEAWIGYSMLLPASFNTNVDWAVFNQLKTFGVVSPDWQVMLSGGKLFWETRVSGTAKSVWSTPATKDVWHNFVIRLKWRKSSGGRVELYHSTGTVTPALQYAADGQTMRAAVTSGVFRQGFYRDSGATGNATMYSANYGVGSSFAAVNPVG